MENLKQDVEKILVYIDLFEQSEHKVFGIGNSKFYKVFNKFDEQKLELEKQQKVSNKIVERIECLKKSL